MNGPPLDRAVWEALDRGDVAHAVHLVARGCGDELYAYCLARSGDATRADDAFSLTLVDVWRGLPGFRREGSVRAWAYVVARRALHRVHRTTWERRREPLPSHDLDALLVHVRTRASSVRREQDRLVSALRESLDEADTELLSLRIDEELSWLEIARILSTPADPEDDPAAASPLGDTELAKRAAAMRQRFGRLKTRLRAEAARLARDNLE